MTNTEPFPDRVRAVFQPSPNGVVGLVDGLLGLSRDHHLRLSFQDHHCIVHQFDVCEPVTVPVPKSVFRAALARIAALCNEAAPNSVTPYRGEGWVPLDSTSNSPATFRVSFRNTPDEQRLELHFSSEGRPGMKRFTVLLRDKGVVTVHGYALKYVQHPTNANDYGSYGILSRSGGEEVLVALFRVSEVIGIFDGDLRDTRSLA